LTRRATRVSYKVRRAVGLVRAATTFRSRADMVPGLLEQACLAAGLHRAGGLAHLHLRRCHCLEGHLQRAETLEDAQVDALLRVRVHLEVRVGDEVDHLELQRGSPAAEQVTTLEARLRRRLDYFF